MVHKKTYHPIKRFRLPTPGKFKKLCLWLIASGVPIEAFGISLEKLLPGSIIAAVFMIIGGILIAAGPLMYQAVDWKEVVRREEDKLKNDSNEKDE